MKFSLVSHIHEIGDAREGPSLSFNWSPGVLGCRSQAKKSHRYEPEEWNACLRNGPTYPSGVVGYGLKRLGHLFLKSIKHNVLYWLDSPLQDSK